jgi:cyclic pyranopterin phosphate synthase
MPEEGIKLLPVDKILSLEDLYFFSKVASELGINKIRITGGEPLLRKNIIFLIKNIVNLEKIKDVSITTNGVFLEEYVDELKNAGINRINISLDTLKRDKFKFITRRDYFDKVIRGIKKAVEKGFNPVKINIVAIKNFNSDEILDFIKFGIENNLEIRFIEFMPFGDVQDLRFLSMDDIKKEIEKQFKLTKMDNTSRGPAKMFKINNYNSKVGFISPITEHFCSTCNRIRLTCDGNIKTCLFSDKLENVFPEIKSHKEDILKARIIEIVKNKPEKHKISLQDYKFKKCQNEMRKIGG